VIVPPEPLISDAPLPKTMQFSKTPPSKQYTPPPAPAGAELLLTVQLFNVPPESRWAPPPW
jgi:hypothetical protein